MPPKKPTKPTASGVPDDGGGPWTDVVRRGTPGRRQSSATPGGAAPAAAEADDKTASPNAPATAIDGGSAGAASPDASTVAAQESGARVAVGGDAEPPAWAMVLDAIKSLDARIGALEPASGSTRWADYPTDDEDSEAGSRSGGAYSTDESDATDSTEGAPEYLRVSSTQRHWGASRMAIDPDPQPHRFSLYGNEYYDALKHGRHGGGGTLSVCLEYAEPTCLYLETSVNAVKAMVDDLRDGRLVDPRDIEALSNTLQGVYRLSNRFRSLCVERAKAVRPGATKADKKRQQWVESQLNEDAYATADVEPEIRKLKAQYDYEAGKQDLRKLASAGGASTGGRTRSGGDRRGEDDDDGRRSGRPNRSASRRNRRERQERDRSAERTERPGKSGKSSKGKGGDRRSGGRRADSSADEGSRRTRRENSSRRSTRSPPPRAVDSRRRGGDGKRADGGGRGGSRTRRDGGGDRHRPPRRGRGSRRDDGSDDSDEEYDSWSES